MLLYADVGEDDAPARIRVGSHLDVPAALAPAGDKAFAVAENHPASHPVVGWTAYVAPTPSAGVVNTEAERGGNPG